jgi:hypothetical protein
MPAASGVSRVTLSESGLTTKTKPSASTCNGDARTPAAPTCADAVTTMTITAHSAIAAERPGAPMGSLMTRPLL